MGLKELLKTHDVLDKEIEIQRKKYVCTLYIPQESSAEASLAYAAYTYVYCLCTHTRRNLEMQRHICGCRHPTP